MNDKDKYNWVTVAFVTEEYEAEEYISLLKDNDIPAKSGEEQQGEAGPEIPVMVPQNLLDEAHVLIESQFAYDDFYDFALEDIEGVEDPWEDDDL